MLRDAVGRGRVHVELLGCLTEGSGSMRMDLVVDSAAGDSMAMHEVTGRVNKCSRMGILFYIPTINIQQRFSPPQRVEKL
jgi:hypothetical protein